MLHIRRFRALHQVGVSIAAIARETGHDWKTVKKYLQGLYGFRTHPTEAGDGSVDLDAFHDHLAQALEQGRIRCVVVIDFASREPVEPERVAVPMPPPLPGPTREAKPVAGSALFTDTIDNAEPPIAIPSAGCARGRGRSRRMG